MIKFHLFSGLCMPLALFVLLSGVCNQPESDSKEVSTPVSQLINDSFPYNLEAPVINLELTDARCEEISALSLCKNPDQLLSIADEKGEFYFIDIKSGEVQEAFEFRSKGDFEGIELVGDTIFAVKSDATLFKITGWDTENPAASAIELGLSKVNDIEGLGYDSARQLLLIALKQDPVSDTVRCIMGFDLNKQKLLSEPIYRIDPNEVNKLVPDGPEDKPNYLSPSGVAIHPLTRDVYILSSAKKRLVVLDYNSGAIKYATRISKELLPQPEGICFDPEGNLFISSEAKKGLPKILKFEPKKP